MKRLWNKNVMCITAKYFFSSLFRHFVCSSSIWQGGRQKFVDNQTWTSSLKKLKNLLILGCQSNTGFVCNCAECQLHQWAVFWRSRSMKFKGHNMSQASVAFSAGRVVKTHTVSLVWFHLLLLKIRDLFFSSLFLLYSSTLRFVIKEKWLKIILKIKKKSWFQ